MSMVIIIDLGIIVFRRVNRQLMQTIRCISPVNSRHNQKKINDLTFSAVSFDRVVDQTIHLIMALKTHYQQSIFDTSCHRNQHLIPNKVNFITINKEANQISRAKNILLKYGMTRIHRRVILVCIQNHSYSFISTDVIR